MSEKSRPRDKQQLVELTTDFLGEDRHEFVAKLAYELWAERGRPFGSPEVDWFAAEHAVCESLEAAGMITAFPNDSRNVASQSVDSQSMSEKLYR
jgi:hypothetical protein